MTELQIPIDEKQGEHEMNRDPITGTPGAHPVGTGIGAAGGAAAGAAVGAMAGPAGLAVGGVVGAIAGGLVGKGVGESVNPTATEVVIEPSADDRSGMRLDASDEDLYWQRAFITEPYYNSEFAYDDYGPAYRIGYLHRQHMSEHPTWEQAETVLQSEWDRNRGTSRLSWEDARDPIRAAWHRVDGAKENTGDPYFGVN